MFWYFLQSSCLISWLTGILPNNERPGICNVLNKDYGILLFERRAAEFHHRLWRDIHRSACEKISPHASRLFHHLERAETRDCDFVTCAKRICSDVEEGVDTFFHISLRDTRSLGYGVDKLSFVHGRVGRF